MRKGSSATWISLLVALPILYVLSIGPVAYLTLTGAMPASVPSWTRQFYAPLDWLEHTPLRQPLDSYMAWWLRLAINQDPSRLSGR